MPNKKQPQKTKTPKVKEEKVATKKAKTSDKSSQNNKTVDLESLPKVKPPNVKAFKEFDAQPDFPIDYQIVKNCLLQVTDIKDNHNKFYSMELHSASNGKARLFTHYGRTDDLQRFFVF